MALDSVHYWVACQVLIDLALLVLVWVFARSFKKGLRKEAVDEAVKEVIGLLEPLLKEAETTAATFENQLKEKARLVRSINERLDSRIISLNLLLNRAGAQASENQARQMSPPVSIYDQQEAILKLYGEKFEPEEIARKLSMPRGEVDLVIDLKKKFAAIS